MANGDSRTRDAIPSTSTVSGALLGTPLAIIIVWAAREFGGVSIPGEVGAAIGTVCGAVIGYFFAGGKSGDMNGRAET